MSMRTTLGATLMVGLATLAAPANALSCREFVRADVLGDRDVLDRAAAIGWPWFEAESAFSRERKDSFGGSAEDYARILLPRLAADCRELPDETVESIVATRLKATKRRSADRAAAQAADQAKAAKEATVIPIPVTLSAFERTEVEDSVRECWTKDAGALDIDKQRVLLTVTMDADGVARKVEVSGDDVGRMTDPRFRAFAERARQTVMDPRCANLPLPNRALVPLHSDFDRLTRVEKISENQAHQADAGDSGVSGRQFQPVKITVQRY
jgi:hypothetical protein